MKEIPLEEIEYVLLDMDGTLLDKYFDDYFWEHLVPEKYAEKNDITFGKAKEELLETYKKHEGTLNWTDIDFWSRELDLDIPAMKEQIRHLIEVHPHVEDFLIEMRKHKKLVCLITNAHYKTVDIKFNKTGLGKYFDRIITSFEMGYPKEDVRFWHKTAEVLGFDKDNTLFIDDNEPMLESARAFGIKYLLLKGRASSREKAKKSKSFLYIKDFNELLDSKV